MQTISPMKNQYVNKIITKYQNKTRFSPGYKPTTNIGTQAPITISSNMANNLYRLDPSKLDKLKLTTETEANQVDVYAVSRDVIPNYWHI